VRDAIAEALAQAENRRTETARPAEDDRRVEAARQAEEEKRRAEGARQAEEEKRQAKAEKQRAEAARLAARRDGGTGQIKGRFPNGFLDDRRTGWRVPTSGWQTL
jgi:hypothetical protein